MLICIDPGHGGSDPGAVSINGHLEKKNTLAIAKEIQKRKDSIPGVDFIFTRLEDSLLAHDAASDLKARVTMANEAGADIYISIHQNADPNNKGRGVEVFYFSSGKYISESGKTLAGYVQNKIVKATGLLDRGIKPGSFYVLRNTDMPAILIEAGFVGGDPKEAEYVSESKTIASIAEAILRGVADYLEVEYQEISSKQIPVTPVEGKTLITGQPKVIQIQAEQFIKEMAPQWVFVVNIYYFIATLYNIRADVALAQACKETNYFKFTGVVKPEFNNYCGLKTASAKGNSPSDHARFPSPEAGVEAHIQHLYCYATELPIPQGRKLIDPRFDIVAELVGRGAAKTVEQLGGLWAPDLDYGKSIINDFLQKMINFSLNPASGTGNSNDYAQEISNLKKEQRELLAKINKFQQEVDEQKKKLISLETKVSQILAKCKEIGDIN